MASPCLHGEAERIIRTSTKHPEVKARYFGYVSGITDVVTGTDRRYPLPLVCEPAASPGAPSLSSGHRQHVEHEALSTVGTAEAGVVPGGNWAAAGRPRPPSG